MNASDVTGVVIVNFNAGAWLTRCVRAVASSSIPVEVVVVDNASTDDSLEELASVLPVRVQVEILRNTANRGYARACNQGAAHTRTSTLVFLNPDCIVESGTLETLRAALATQPDAGLAGALVLNPDGTEQRATRRHLPSTGRAFSTVSGLERLGVGGVSATSQPLGGGAEQVEAVSGALLCLRREAFDAVGGFDERYFLHCEDLDLFARLQEAGWKLLLVPSAQAVHGHGVSSASVPVRTWWHKHLGMQRYFNRHLKAGQSPPMRWIVTAGIWLRCVAFLPWVALRSLFARGRSVDRV